MTRRSPVSAAHRALLGLPLASTGHAANLAAQAKRLLEVRDGPASWLLAERLARLRSGLVADDLVLRAIALAAMNDAEQARNDVRRALVINPWHPMANRLMLTSTEPAERELAARRLLRGDGTTTLVQDALRVLGGQGVEVAGNVESAAQHIRGWLAWRGGSTLKCHLESSYGSVEHSVEAEPRHPMAGAFVHAADIIWPWPGDAEWVDVACDAARSVLLQERLWRHAPQPALRGTRPLATTATAGTRRVAVIVPVYDDFEATKQCLDAVLAYPERRLTRRIIAVDDSTPDPRIAALLEELWSDGKIELLRNDVNRGFAASVNRGLGVLAADEDVVLLNADTVAPPDLCARLARVAYLHNDIGTVTPLSNNGEYTSMPVRFRENPIPQGNALAALDRLAAENMDGVDDFVELPNGVGFCLYVKRAVLDAVGLLSLQFGRGYCEDIDFCLRARRAGFRNVCATGVFVGHAGSRSFKSEKRALVLTNLSRIDDLYPSYRRLSAEFVRRDPLRALAGRLEWKWLLAREKPFALVVSASERDASLIGRYANARRASGLDTIVATLDARPDGVAVSLRDQSGDYPQNVLLTYGRDGVPEDLAHDLARLRIAELTIADPGNLPMDFVRALTEIGMAYDVLLADAGIFDMGGEGNTAPAAVRSLPSAVAADSTLTATILSKARRIVTPTVRFSRALISRMPHLVPKIDLPLDGPFGNATVQPAAKGGGGLLIACASPSTEESELIHALAALLRQADPDAGVIADGTMADDLKTMELGNVFVLGREPSESLMSTTCRVPTSGVVFPSRRWGMSDTRVEAVMALGLPVAHFDHTVKRSKAAGENLLLSAREPLPAVISALLQWWRGLAASGTAGRPASVTNATPARPQLG
jgi:O-antigen biosynthesis protein